MTLMFSMYFQRSARSIEACPVEIHWAPKLNDFG